jgi:hypothetical protein
MAVKANEPPRAGGELTNSGVSAQATLATLSRGDRLIRGILTEDGTLRVYAYTRRRSYPKGELPEVWTAIELDSEGHLVKVTAGANSWSDARHSLD